MPSDGDGDGDGDSNQFSTKWTVRTANKSLQLAIAVPGLVFVRRLDANEEDANVAARVEFHGDAEPLLKCIDVQSSHSVVQLTTRKRVASSLPFGVHRGRLLGEIFVRKAMPVTSLSVVGDTLVVLQDEDVLCCCGTDAPMPLTINCMGKAASVLVSQQQNLHCQSLAIHVTGQGTVQMALNKLQIDQQMQLDVMGQGCIVLCTQELNCAGSLTSQLTGKNQLSVVARDGFRVADRVQVQSTGESKVLFSTKKGHGKCHGAMEIVSIGQSQLDLASIQCNSAHVKPTGEVSIVLDVVDSLQVSGWSQARVEYVGDRPRHVECTSFHQQTVQPARSGYQFPDDPTSNCALEPLPAREPVQVSVSKWFNLLQWLGLQRLK